MRGPAGRLKFDVRRTWRCTQCGYERHVPATETAVRCHCSKDEPWMRLVEHQRPVRAVPAPLDLYINAEDPLPEDGPCVSEGESAGAATEIALGDGSPPTDDPPPPVTP